MRGEWAERRPPESQSHARRALGNHETAWLSARRSPNLVAVPDLLALPLRKAELIWFSGEGAIGVISKTHGRFRT